MTDPGPPRPPLDEERTRQVRDLEARIGHEWEALRGLYEDELKALRQRGLELTPEHELAGRSVETGPARWPFLFLTLALVGLVAAVVYLGWSVAEVARRADDAERRAAEVGEATARDAASRMALEGMVSSAFARSLEGQRMAHVLVAPDLVRTPLVAGAPAPGAQGLMFWSPSAGAVLTALGVPVPSGNRRLMAWVETGGNVYRLGTVSPDSDGRLRAAFEPLPVSVRATRAFTVTEEAEEAPVRPGDKVVLASQ